MFARILFLLGEFVAKFANVNNAADRRNGVRGNFHEVHAVLAGEVQRIVQRKHAKLVAVWSDHAHFAGANLAVDAHLRGGGGITRGKRATQATLSGWG